MPFIGLGLISFYGAAVMLYHTSQKMISGKKGYLWRIRIKLETSSINLYAF